MTEFWLEEQELGKKKEKEYSPGDGSLRWDFSRVVTGRGQFCTFRTITLATDWMVDMREERLHRP